MQSFFSQYSALWLYLFVLHLALPVQLVRQYKSGADPLCSKGIYQVGRVKPPGHVPFDGNHSQA